MDFRAENNLVILEAITEMDSDSVQDEELLLPP